MGHNSTVLDGVEGEGTKKCLECEAVNHIDREKCWNCLGVIFDG